MRGAARTSFFAIAYLQRIFYKFFFFFKKTEASPDGGIRRAPIIAFAPPFFLYTRRRRRRFFYDSTRVCASHKREIFFPLRWMQSIEKWHPGVKKHGDGVSKKKRIFFFFWSGKLSSSGERMSQASDYFRAHLLISFLGPV